MGSLPVINLAEARYECTFGRGCDGVCCREGRPPMFEDEVERIDAHLARLLPELRPEARAAIERDGYLTQRIKCGLPTLRVVGGWCIFFNRGCVLHRVGEAEGDKYRYKPASCSVFPLTRDNEGNWYVRQRGYKKDKWDLFCLDPNSTTVAAAESLREEMDLAYRYSLEGEEAPLSGGAENVSNGHVVAAASSPNGVMSPCH